MSRFRFTRTFLGVVALAVGAALLVGCADSADPAREANATEQAFLAAMVPHHESAVAMAEAAARRASHRPLRELARAIVDEQQTEIATMAHMHMRLTGEVLRPNPDTYQQLGLSAEQAGMMHDGRQAVAELKRARAFDRAFIDAMVPHHQGAIRMARAVLAQADDEELRRLAGRIETAQAGEIRQMNRWRASWYGAPSPAGGVPKGGSSGAEPMENAAGGAHEGH